MKAILNDKLWQPLLRLLAKLRNNLEKGEDEMDMGSKEGASDTAAARYKRQYQATKGKKTMEYRKTRKPKRAPKRG